MRSWTHGGLFVRVRWTEEATTDLVEIIDFIEQRNVQVARDLHSALLVTAANLAASPHLFRRGRVTGTREAVVHPNYILVYQVTDTVDILRILHARQQYPD